MAIPWFRDVPAGTNDRVIQGMDEHGRSAHGRYIIDDDTVPGVLYSEYSWRLLRQQAYNNNSGEDGRRIAIALVEIRGSAICQLIAKKCHEEC